MILWDKTVLVLALGRSPEDAPRLQQGRHRGSLGQVQAAQRPLLAYPAVRLVQLAQADLELLGRILCITHIYTVVPPLICDILLNVFGIFPQHNDSV